MVFLPPVSLPYGVFRCLKEIVMRDIPQAMMSPKMLLSCLVLCLLGVSCSAHRSATRAANSFTSGKEEWLAFKNRHGKVYPDQQTEEKRYKAFVSNMQYIQKHNTLYQRGNTTFYLAVNAFSDLTHEEFVTRMRLDIEMRHRNVGATEFFAPSFIQLPDSVDWRQKGYVTPVKNQGQCGSCWSFSTTGSMEGQHFKKTGKLLSLSEQQLVDCSSTYGDHGCKGGLMDFAFDYVKDRGLESETSYPYTAKQDTCRYDLSLVVAKCVGHVDVPKKESALKSAVGTVGPVSVAIDASHRSFQHYSGGVYDEPECSSIQLDHGVLTVGYGTDRMGGDYWIVKNSWGEMWGEEGYIKMSRNKNNQCGIASQASYPLV